MSIDLSKARVVEPEEMTIERDDKLVTVWVPRIKLAEHKKPVWISKDDQLLKFDKKEYAWDRAIIVLEQWRSEERNKKRMNEELLQIARDLLAEAKEKGYAQKEVGGLRLQVESAVGGWLSTVSREDGFLSDDEKQLFAKAAGMPDGWFEKQPIKKWMFGASYDPHGIRGKGVGVDFNMVDDTPIPFIGE